jgi:hypothetical protein
MSTKLCASPTHKNWKELYRAALFEADSNRLSQRIALAERALAARARELFYAGGEDLQERVAIDAAISALQTLHATTTGERERKRMHRVQGSLRLLFGDPAGINPANECDERLKEEQSWKKLYEAALLEFNLHLLPERIAEAQEAIGQRVLTLRLDGEVNSEMVALENARVVLGNLTRVFHDRTDCKRLA